MKPICAHPYYCEDDPRTIYLGQDGQISSTAGPNGMPSGWAAVAKNFHGLCLYTGAGAGAGRWAA